MLQVYVVEIKDRDGRRNGLPHTVITEREPNETLLAWAEKHGISIFVHTLKSNRIIATAEGTAGPTDFSRPTLTIEVTIAPPSLIG